MSISITNKTRIVAVALGVALVLAVALSGFATPAHAALSSAQVQSIISLLQSFGADATTIANVQASLTGGTPSSGGSTGGSSSCTFTRSLTMGSSGADVTCLQQGLISMGFSIPAGATGYFGAQTQSAVAAWQTSKGVTPAAGYFGPISQAAWGTTSGGGTSGGGTSGGPLQGGAGSIVDADYVAGLSNEEVGEDGEDVEVAGLELEADEGSDIEITAVRLNFTAGTADEDLEEYATEVSVWVNGEEVARMDADEFTDDDNFDKTISLDSGGIIEAGETGDLVVAVSGQSNLSGNTNETWTLEFESVRFRDADGATITDSDTGDINDATGRTFSFETFATAEDIELKAQASSDTPEGIITVDDSSDTDGVEVLRFSLEAEGGDINVKDIPITIATSTGNTADTVAEIFSTFYLTVDGEEYSESVSGVVVGPSGATLTFDEVDFTIDEGDEVEVVVTADVNDTEAGSFVDGDAVTVSYTDDNHASVDAEDETGENLADSDKTGTGNGDEVAFYATGIAVEFVSASETVTTGSGGNDDAGTFVIKFTVEAIGDTVFVADSATATTDSTPTTGVTADGHQYVVFKGSTATVDDVDDTVDFTTSGGASQGSNGIQLDEGDSTEITLTVSRTNDDTSDPGLYSVDLVGIEWDTVDTLGTGSGNLYTFDLDDFETDAITLN